MDKSKHGFAGMTPEQRKQLGSKGGIATRNKGTGHRFTSITGQQAAKKAHRKPEAAPDNPTDNQWPLEGPELSPLGWNTENTSGVSTKERPTRTGKLAGRN